ncbi:MAG: carboxypeptidase-like regulatory domain-containing protein [Muribaculaceae bacterium]|nr:carboxypeptidase-like regulatory domain-containing protein [Muribaculaceae bacterium]
MFFFWVVASLNVILGASTDYFIRGIVRDSITDESIPNAFVSVTGTSLNVMTDGQGIFEMTIPDKTHSLTIKSQGYATQILPITKNRVNVYAVYLKPEAITLDELVVKKQKYSKKDNPAVELMRHIRRTASIQDPTRQPYFNQKTYQRISLALDNIDASGEKGLLARFPFLIDHLDTSLISGKPILPVSVREQSADIYYRSNPQGRHVVVTGKRSSGIDEMLDQESMDVFMNDIFGPVDIYARDIVLLQNRFVSPLSPIADDFYKFFITDSLTDTNGQKFYVLSFYPHNKASFGFNGSMEVTVTDSTAFVRNVNMRVPGDINLNFIENLNISQKFGQTPDGLRLIEKDEMIIEAQLLPGTQGLYAHRIIEYNDYDFEPPKDEIRIFKPRVPVTTMTDAASRDSVFWHLVNPGGLPTAQAKVGTLLDKFRQNKVFYWGEKFIKILVTGYVATDGSKSKFDVGPMNTTISANPLEGLRLRAGGITTANLNPHWFARFYGAYGFKDHRWKYGLELEYSINAKQRHTREFPVHSLRLTSTYDVDRPGQQYAFTNPDNVFLSLHRPGIDPMTYHRLNSLLYTLELETHFSVKMLLCNERQYESNQMRFNLSGGGHIPFFDETYASLELRFAPEEKFYQTTSNRFPVNLDRPVFAITQTLAPKSFGNFGSINATQAMYRQRFWFSAFGYLDVMAKAGHVWSKHTPFNHLFIANTNLSYTIQPESFSLTAPMELVADSFGNLDLTYWANGAILNYVPVIKKLKLREVFSVQGFYGHLSAANNPAVTPGLIVWPGYETTAKRLNTPYLEASVGLDNILRCLRVDYVWRLTHRHDMVDGANRWGIRVQFHVTF